jgi:hypothetical protein
MTQRFALVFSLLLAMTLALPALAQDEPTTDRAADPTADSDTSATTSQAESDLTQKADEYKSAFKTKMTGADHADCPCPACPMNKEHKAAMSGKDMDAHQKQMHLLMNAEISKLDPAAILAMEDELNLTQEQRDKLHQIRSDAHRETAELLNEEQEQKLANLPADEFSFQEVHSDMVAQAHPEEADTIEPLDERPSETAQTDRGVGVESPGSTPVPGEAR